MLFICQILINLTRNVSPSQIDKVIVGILAGTSSMLGLQAVGHCWVAEGFDSVKPLYEDHAGAGWNDRHAFLFWAGCGRGVRV